MLLLSIRGYKQFLHFNSIKEDIAKLVVPFFKYLNVKNGEYIFHEGDHSKNFYCILKGKISIRKDIENNHFKKLKCSDTILSTLHAEVENYCNYKKKAYNYTAKSFVTASGSSQDYLKNEILKNKYPNTKFIANSNEKINSHNNNHNNFNYTKNNFLSEQEKEIIVYKDGNCFGDWGVIYNKLRSASAVALEDLDLIYIEKENFNEFFSKYLIKADQERRIFLKNIIQPLKNVTKFDDIYQRIIYVTLGFNELVFNENSESKYFYLIYSGQFRVEKNIKHDYLTYRDFIRSRNDFFSNEDNDNIIMRNINQQNYTSNFRINDDHNNINNLFINNISEYNNLNNKSLSTFDNLKNQSSIKFVKNLNDCNEFNIPKNIQKKDYFISMNNEKEDKDIILKKIKNNVLNSVLKYNKNLKFTSTCNSKKDSHSTCNNSQNKVNKNISNRTKKSELYEKSNFYLNQKNSSKPGKNNFLINNDIGTNAKNTNSIRSFGLSLDEIKNQSSFFIENVKKEEEQNEYNNKKYHSSFIKTLIKFEKGSFAGLENVFDIPYYRYSLRAVGEHNSVFRIAVKDLFEIRNDIEKFLIGLFINQDEIFTRLISKQEQIKINRKMKNKEYSQIFNKLNKSIRTVNIRTKSQERLLMKHPTRKKNNLIEDGEALNSKNYKNNNILFDVRENKEFLNKLNSSLLNCSNNIQNNFKVDIMPVSNKISNINKRENLEQIKNNHSKSSAHNTAHKKIAYVSCTDSNHNSYGKNKSYIINKEACTVRTRAQTAFIQTNNYKCIQNHHINNWNFDKPPHARQIDDNIFDSLENYFSKESNTHDIFNRNISKALKQEEFPYAFYCEDIDKNTFYNNIYARNRLYYEDPNSLLLESIKLESKRKDYETQLMRGYQKLGIKDLKKSVFLRKISLTNKNFFEQKNRTLFEANNKISTIPPLKIKSNLFSSTASLKSFSNKLFEFNNKVNTYQKVDMSSSKLYQDIIESNKAFSSRRSIKSSNQNSRNIVKIISKEKNNNSKIMEDNSYNLNSKSNIHSDSNETQKKKDYSRALLLIKPKGKVLSKANNTTNSFNNFNHNTNSHINASSNTNTNNDLNKMILNQRINKKNIIEGYNDKKAKITKKSIFVEVKNSIKFNSPESVDKSFDQPQTKFFSNKKVKKKKQIFIQEYIKGRADMKISKNFPYKSGFYALPLVTLCEND